MVNSNNLINQRVLKIVDVTFLEGYYYRYILHDKKLFKWFCFIDMKYAIKLELLNLSIFHFDLLS